LLVELTHERHKILQPEVGEQVLVSLRNVRIFTEDYAI